jgi:hypothetical protein
MLVREQERYDMTTAERWHIMNEMAHAKFPFTGNPYSMQESDANSALVAAERKRLIADHTENGDNSELAQEIARLQSVEA